MKNLIIIILLCCTSFCAQAQNSRYTPQPDSLIRIIYDGRHQLYTIGGRLVTPEEVKTRLTNYPSSAAEFKLAKSNATWAYISFGGCAVASIIAIIDFKNNDKLAGAYINNNTNTIMYQQHSHAGAYVFTGLATAFLFSSVFNLIKSGQHSKKAMKIYNERFE